MGKIIVVCSKCGTEKIFEQATPDTNPNKYWRCPNCGSYGQFEFKEINDEKNI